MSRDDVNMPNFDGAPIHKQVLEVKFEVAVYELLRSEINVLASRLLYYHIPMQHLFLLEKAEGENNIWRDEGTC
jgi:hypothetical protein